MGYQKEIMCNTVVVQTTGIVAADMDGEKVMLNIEQGKYYGLDGIGSRIWEMIESPRKVQEVVAVMLKEYDVGEKNCQQDVLAFLSTLYAQGLVDLD